MTLQFDKASATAVIVGGGDGTDVLAHSPTGTLRAALVLIHQRNNFGNQVGSVFYGPTAMTPLEPHPHEIQAGVEIGGLYGFFLGGNISAGAQDITLTHTPTSDKIMTVLGWTAAGNCEVAYIKTLDAVIANPSVDFDLIAGDEVAIAAALYTGQSTDASIAAGSGYTKITLPEPQFGGQTAAVQRRTSLATGPGTFACGWTVAIEEMGIFAVAIREIAGGGGGGGGTKARRRLNPGLN